MRDALLVGALLISFATLVTTHVAIGVRMLCGVRPRRRAVAALLVPPLAVWQAFVQGWQRMAWLWLGSLAVYVTALVIASF